MGLQVWLPLNGNLENKGLGEINNIQGTPSYRTNGKTGSALELNTRITISCNQLINLSTFTLCFWVNVNSSTSLTANWVDIIGFSNISSTGTQGTFRCETCYNSSDWKGAHWHDNTTYAMLGSKVSGTEVHTKNDDIWYHCALVCNNKLSKIYFYTNGELTGEFVHNGGIINNTGSFYIGETNNIAGAINDVRFYDEALSPMQIKLISQGLVAHYLLNRNGLGATNLLKNGFGELGTENWSSASKVFDDVPSNHPEIYHSFRDVESVEYIPIYRNHTYQFSTWIKAPSSSGISYPGLRPYDADKNFIYYYNCTEGFNLSTMTTLTHELKTGDTKIYVSDLSAWNANSGHNYNYAALFGYTDGTGYTYPDGFYTRDLGIFGSGTSAKTNLDKTNNIITLNSAYTGANKPIGTKVCASTAGSTYYYPFGGINNTTIGDWTYKEGTFSSEVSRLSAAKYVRVYAYSYQAGITLTDLTLLSTEDNIEYDVSGYCNNGTKYNITDYTSDTPRYSVATKFNGSSCIKNNNFNLSGKIWSVSCWYYKSENPTGYEGLFCLSKNSGSDADKKIAAMPNAGRIWYKGESGSLSISKLKIAEWTLLTMTCDGTVVKIYENDTLIGSYNAGNEILDANDLVIGARASSADAESTSVYFTGQISDFRVYATALSESDIQSLYNNSAFIDSSGNVYSTEYTEL